MLFTSTVGGLGVVTGVSSGCMLTAGVVTDEGVGLGSPRSREKTAPGETQ